SRHPRRDGRARQGRRRSQLPDARGPEHRLSWVSVQNPLVGSQVLQSFLDGCPDGERRFPSELSDPAGIEQNERVVPDPTTRAAGIFEPWLKIQRRADPGDRVVDFAIGIMAEIEYVDSVVGPGKGEQHRVETVLYIQIGFALAAVAEDAQSRAIGAQLPAEVGHVSMRVPLAENRDES